MTEHQRVMLRAEDGHDIPLQVWRPEGAPTHILQILHGLGEHSDRYARFAKAANERGIAVYCHDHRGHGEHADQLGYFAAKNGWGLLVADALAVFRHVEAEHSGVPIILLGHSMGSYIAQSFLIRHSPSIAALILSSSTWPSRAKLFFGSILAHIESWRLDRHRHSPLLDKLGFGDFNKPFQPARTELDWLSRDDAEVDRYIEDPLCGGPYTTGLWLDLTSGLKEIASDAALRRIDASLPILITGGAADPIGGDKGMTKLLLHYAQTGHQRLKVKIYPEGRHEMLNDSVRDQVTSDWLDWIVTTSRSAR
ncbi:MAG: alpha/beta fold hydrolase [Pseudomonadota bacterium]